MFTKLEQRSWIKIEVTRGRSAQECFQGLREACGDAALPYRTVARWVKAFREGLVGSAVKVMFIVAYDIDGVICTTLYLHGRRTPSLFMIMQRVIPLLLSRTSCVAGNGRFWNILRTHPGGQYGTSTNMDALMVYDAFQTFGKSYGQEKYISTKLNHFNYAMNIINNIFNPSLVRKHKRITAYKTLARPVLMYGSETWTIRKFDEHRITANEMKFLRITAGYRPTRLDKKKNLNILKELNRQRIFVPKRTADRVASSGSYIYYVTWMRKQDRIASSKKMLNNLFLNTAKFRQSLMSLDRVFHKRDSEIVYDDEYDDVMCWRNGKQNAGPRGVVLVSCRRCRMENDVTTPSINANDTEKAAVEPLTWHNLCLAALLCILIAVTVSAYTNWLRSEASGSIRPGSDVKNILGETFHASQLYAKDIYRRAMIMPSTALGNLSQIIKYGYLLYIKDVYKDVPTTIKQLESSTLEMYSGLRLVEHLYQSLCEAKPHPSLEPVKPKFGTVLKKNSGFSAICEIRDILSVNGEPSDDTYTAHIFVSHHSCLAMWNAHFLSSKCF
ncbi:hypothetical protein ANN_15259 [Periplaneta americana]|uniref:Mos1 transposase HTH domain-containing protein n=1 Tax=Periplaneta americana TaxID=6978 RepID=A0ABQ8SFX6_PERAM|nr:hypothetical protein ANN_15259 [Periplaneta americana]